MFIDEQKYFLRVGCETLDVKQEERLCLRCRWRESHRSYLHGVTCSLHSADL